MNPSSDARPQEAWDRPFVKEHQEWCDDLVVELRLEDVPGPVIGERLAEVEAHCAETGDTPQDAFGEPSDYARRLLEADAPDPSGVWQVTLLSVAQMLALLVGTSAASSWGGGEALTYNAVQLGSIAAFLALLLTLPLLLRPIVQRPWSVGVPLLALGTLAGAGSAAGGRLGLGTVLTLPAPVVTLGLFLVVVALAVALLRALDEDPVTTPLAPAAAAPARPRRAWGTVLPVPVAYVVLSALSWVLR
ncbi:hypothetical protein FE251_10230 [Georgenia wutianyii]|uniref:Uncharacterized protein n=1 Tax=Georgenia wutianyii TaxID=2585135 RepID=A0ABX5VN98_9MICO|nr:hypothetical protein [Georgenia wutianyii]QDB79710.1 hypothetical protein FE251_10230 [Georgenia wutianyii]